MTTDEFEPDPFMLAPVEPSEPAMPVCLGGAGGTGTSPGYTLDDLERLEDPDDALERQLAHNRDVSEEARKQRIRRDARRLLATEEADLAALPPLQRLDAFLAVPDEDLSHRVADLWPTGGRVVMSAQHKAGKTTLMGNLMRSLVDDEPFLDRHAVQQAQRVILIDNELDERMLRRWLRDQGVVNTDRIHLLPLRGRLSTFNVLDPAVRTRWAQHLGPACVLIFDCLRPALDALGLSEDKDAGRFLEALDELMVETGIGETAVVHHMGHNGERSRGDSRILDWPDAVWKLVKDAEDEEASPGSVRRYFSAYGRDVDVPEGLLDYDHDRRRLTLAGGSRSETAADALIPDVVAFLTDNPGTSQRGLETAMKNTHDHPQKKVRQAIKRGISTGWIDTATGPKNATLHFPSTPSAASAAGVRQRTESVCGSASIEDALHTHTEQTQPVRQLPHTNCGACQDPLLAPQSRELGLCAKCSPIKAVRTA